MVDYWKDVPGINGNEDLMEGYASIHTNPKLEDMLRKAGFDIPKYPKTGDVKYNGKVVGRMDNFNGLMIKSKSALAAIKKAVPKIGIWNEKDALDERAPNRHNIFTGGVEGAIGALQIAVHKLERAFNDRKGDEVLGRLKDVQTKSKALEKAVKSIK